MSAATQQVAAACSEGPQKRLHILALPFPQDGHINGMLRLARALAAQQNVLVTFGYPARYHALAHQRNQLSPDLLPSTSSSSCNTSTLRVDVIDDGLPPEEEQCLTPDLVQASVPIFQKAVKLKLDNLLNRSKPSCSAPLPPLCCIVSDTFMPWTQDLASAVGLPRVEFWTSTAVGYSMGSQLPRLLSDGTLPLPQSCWVDPKKKWKANAPLIDCIPGLSPTPPTDLPAEFVQAKDASDFLVQFILASFSRINEAHTILVHSVYELESQVFDALQANGLPIYAVGPLFHSPPPLAEKGINGMNDCLLWLNKQNPSSVIYVALGTLAKLTPTETRSLALGLEASGHPFLWVIRRDSVSGSVSDILPEGFLQRTVERGLGLIVSWAPQTEVLQHRAIGAFFSHCGWNSTLEAMWEGVPMVACPRAAEQRSNARWIVETWKFGVELERQDDGSFIKEAVQRAVKEVLGVEGHDGGSLKERALALKKIAQAAVQKGGTSHSNLNGFLDRLRVLPSAPL